MTGSYSYSLAKMASHFTAFVGAAIVVLFSFMWTTYGIPVILGSIFLVFSFLLTDFICFDRQSQLLRKNVDGTLANFIVKFVKARQITPAEVNFGGRYNKKLSRWEIEKLVELILRDFVVKWYTSFSEDDHFPSEVRHLLHDFSTVVEERLTSTDTKEVFCDLLSVALRHLSVLNDIGSRQQGVFILNPASVREFLKEPGAPVHLAMQSQETELRYIRACLDCVCELGIPDNFKRASPARLFLREVLAENVLLPLVGLLSDPNFLMRAIIAIFSKSPPERFKAIRKNMQRENECLVERLAAAKHQVTPHEGLVENSPPQATSTPEVERKLSAATATAGGDTDSVTSELATTVDPNLLIMLNFQECENVDSKFVGYTVEFSTAMLTRSSLEELGWTEAAGVSVPIRALTRFSDYEKLVKDWKEESLSSKDIRIMQCVNDLPYLEKTTMYSVMSRLPFPRTSQLDTQMLEGRKKSLEYFLRKTWSLPELHVTNAFQYFLKTSIKRYQWHLGGGTQFVARRGKLKHGNSADELQHQEQPTVYTQAVFTAFLNAQLPVSYHVPPTPARTPVGDAPPMYRTEEITHTEDTTAGESSELTASAVLVSTHMDLLNRKKKLKASKLSEEEAGSRDEQMSPSHGNSAQQGDSCTSGHDSTQPATIGREEFYDFPDYTDEDHTSAQVTSSTDLQDRIKDYLSFVQKALLSSTTKRETPSEVEGDGKLANALFCFATEAARPVCSSLWLCKERIQRALLGLCGGAMDRGLMELVSEVTTDDEKWARILYHLRHTLWPNDVLDVTKGKPLSYPDQRQLRERATKEFKRFLPDVFPYLVGDKNLTDVVEHGLDCLENPELNR
jgi:hypothetical protein